MEEEPIQKLSDLVSAIAEILVGSEKQLTNIIAAKKKIVSNSSVQQVENLKAIENLEKILAKVQPAIDEVKKLGRQLILLPESQVGVKRSLGRM